MVGSIHCPGGKCDDFAVSFYQQLRLLTAAGNAREAEEILKKCLDCLSRYFESTAGSACTLYLYFGRNSGLSFYLGSEAFCNPLCWRGGRLAEALRAPAEQLTKNAQVARYYYCSDLSANDGISASCIIASIRPVVANLDRWRENSGFLVLLSEPGRLDERMARELVMFAYELFEAMSLQRASDGCQGETRGW
jgi:hypothetical protein